MYFDCTECNCSDCKCTDLRWIKTFFIFVLFAYLRFIFTQCFHANIFLKTKQIMVKCTHEKTNANKVRDSSNKEQITLLGKTQKDCRKNKNVIQCVGSLPMLS